MIAFGAYDVIVIGGGPAGSTAAALQPTEHPSVTTWQIERAPHGLELGQAAA